MKGITPAEPVERPPRVLLPQPRNRRWVQTRTPWLRPATPSQVDRSDKPPRVWHQPQQTRLRTTIPRDEVHPRCPRTARWERPPPQDPRSPQRPPVHGLQNSSAVWFSGHAAPQRLSRLSQRLTPGPHQCVPPACAYPYPSSASTLSEAALQASACLIDQPKAKPPAACPQARRHRGPEARYKGRLMWANLRKAD